MPFTLPGTGIVDKFSGGAFTSQGKALVGTDTAQVASYAANVLRVSQQLARHNDELRMHQQRLGQAWPQGADAQAAQVLMGQTSSRLSDTTQTMATVANQIQQTATMVNGAQTGFSTFVNTLTPKVLAASLKPFGGKALATGMAMAGSAATRTFLGTISEVLKAIGLTKFAEIATSLDTIVTGVGKLFGGDTPLMDRVSAGIDIFKNITGVIEKIGDLFTDDKAPALPTAPLEVPTIPDPFATLPAATPALPTVGTTLPSTMTNPFTGLPAPGQSTVGQVDPAALGQLFPAATSSTGTFPSGTFPSGTFPSGTYTGGTAFPGTAFPPVPSGQTPSWVPVDPTASAPAPVGSTGSASTAPYVVPTIETTPTTGADATPATSGADDDDRAVVTTRQGDVEVKIEVPTDKPIALDVTVDTGPGPDVKQRIVVGADGRVTTA